MTSRIGLRLALALLLALCSGCSSFEKRWKAAAANPAATRWEGRWTSQKHRAPGGGPAGGKLRAVFEPAAEQKLTAHFRAHWMVFASDYTMTLEPKPPGPRRGAARDYRGTHELPKMFGGTYRYDARITGDHFAARYDSSYDHGTFALQRVRMAKDCFPAHARH